MKTCPPLLSLGKGLVTLDAGDSLEAVGGTEPPRSGAAGRRRLVSPPPGCGKEDLQNVVAHVVLWS